MIVIVGLGNPGSAYEGTRHNVGFMTIDRLAHYWQATDFRLEHQALVAKYRHATAGPVLLVKPQTYMNFSGVAVAALLAWYKVTVDNMVVIYDDVDLPLGRIRLRLQGSSGGHRGVASIMAHCRRDDFRRVRIGVGRPPAGMDTADYVMARFAATEQPVIAQAVETAAAAVACILAEGMERAMNKFNRR